MPLIREGWSQSLEPGIREWFFNGYNRRPNMASEFFGIQNSEKYQEHFHSFGAISPDAWDLFKSTGQVPSVSYDAGYKTTFTNATYMVELPIQRELIEDNRYSEIIDATTRLGDSAALKREKDAASVFVNAFSSSFVGGDGVALCSDSHPHSPNKAGTTQDNNFALSLTADNVETVRQAMMAFTDDTGELVGVMPNLLIVPPELENQAKVITQSEYKIGSMDNDINPQRGRFSYLVWHYLTDANAWFMVDSTLMKMSLIWFNRIPLNIYRKNQDDSVFAVYVARMRYSYGWRDWRWIAGSNPS